MGIQNILKEIGKGERVALSKLAVDHLERTRRPLRIAIDTAIWNFKSQAGRGGAHPELRTLFYKLLKLLALPIHPVFVYDGKNKPLTKRGKTRTAWGSNIQNETSKKLIQLFRYPHHTAPGEAEAECAFLQKHGVVDAVMSEDVDTIMFGSGMTLRNWSKEGTRGNKTPTHVDVYRKADIESAAGLTPAGLVLVALLRGGDYDQNGVTGFGSTLAAEIAKAGFGEELLDLVAKDDTAGLEEWRMRLQTELETNESGYFKVKRKTLKIPASFPDRTMLDYYTNPAVSPFSDLPLLQAKWEDEWNKEIDIKALRQYGADKFQWRYDTGAKHFVRQLAAPLLACRLWRALEGINITSVDQITGRRLHFSTDGQPELSVTFIPNDVVGLDIEAEEKNPSLAAEEIPENDEEALDEIETANAETTAITKQLKGRKSPPWDPAAPEKLWMLETILKLGVPEIVEAWEEKQRDILSDPVKFATRNVKTKQQSMLKDSGMKAGALDAFFNPPKPGAGQSRDVSTKAISRAP